MHLEDQVVSLELAKKLKELGVKQEGYFNWYLGLQAPYLGPANKRSNSDTVAAFTVAELGEMFRYVRTEFTKTEAGDWAVYWVADNGRYHKEYGTEADARAKMLIYLIENKLITL